MKRIFSTILCVLLLLSFCSCSSCEDDEGGTLKTPVVTINATNVASWESIKGAVSYEYKINDGDAIKVEADVTKIQLVAGEKISVRAIGDGEKYFDGEWCEPVRTAVAPTLPKPTLEAQVFGEQVIVSWQRDPRASGYEYRLNTSGEAPFDGEEMAFLISKGDTLYIRAKGDGTNYLDSDWAIIKPE